jgi:hypothetical protein
VGKAESDRRPTVRRRARGCVAGCRESFRFVRVEADDYFVALGDVQGRHVQRFAKDLCVSRRPFPWIQSIRFTSGTAPYQVMVQIRGANFDRDKHFELHHLGKVPVHLTVPVFLEEDMVGRDTRGRLAEAVRSALHEAIRHELDEAFYLYDETAENVPVRLFDPHRGETP